MGTFAAMILFVAPVRGLRPARAARLLTLKVPKLRRLPFETAVIERYRRRETSVEEALVEMYLAGVSVRRSSMERSRFMRLSFMR